MTGCVAGARQADLLDLPMCATVPLIADKPLANAAALIDGIAVMQRRDRLCHECHEKMLLYTTSHPSCPRQLGRVGGLGIPWLSWIAFVWRVCMGAQGA